MYRLPAALLALAAIPALAAPDSASVSFRLRAHVPAVCRAEAVPLGDGVSFRVREFCNVAHGYRLYALHPSGAFLFEYDGTLIPPDPGGRTLLWSSRVAARRTVVLRLRRVPGAAPPASIRLEIVPES